MTEETHLPSQLSPDKIEEFNNALEKLHEFLDANPEIQGFLPAILDRITDEQGSSKRPTLPESRISAPLRKPIIVNDKGTLPIAVHPRDIPHTGKNRT